jgi:iron complex transport system substrate-binding protein
MTVGPELEPRHRFVAEWRRWTILALLLVIPCVPAQARPITDAAGRTVDVPDRVERVLPAGPPASVLLYMLGPAAMVGWAHGPSAAAKAYLEPGVAGLPELGALTHGDAVDTAAIGRLHPDLIVDFGTVSPRYGDLATKVQAATGVPYLLLDGRLEKTPDALRLLGAVLGDAARGERLAAAAEQILSATRNAAAGSGSSPLRAYYGRGPDGLTTGTSDSISLEDLRWLGLSNVAGDSGRGGFVKTTREQLLAWNPDLVLTLDPAFATSLRSDPAWAGLSAVRNGRVLLAPRLPFGWIDEPPSVNRLLGLVWLAHQLHLSAGDGLRGKTRDFYHLFYRVDPTDAQLDELLATP